MFPLITKCCSISIVFRLATQFYLLLAMRTPPAPQGRSSLASEHNAPFEGHSKLTPSLREAGGIMNVEPNKILHFITKSNLLDSSEALNLQSSVAGVHSAYAINNLDFVQGHHC